MCAAWVSAHGAAPERGRCPVNGEVGDCPRIGFGMRSWLRRQGRRRRKMKADWLRFLPARRNRSRPACWSAGRNVPARDGLRRRSVAMRPAGFAKGRAFGAGQCIGACGRMRCRGAARFRRSVAWARGRDVARRCRPFPERVFLGAVVRQGLFGWDIPGEWPSRETALPATVGCAPCGWGAKRTRQVDVGCVAMVRRGWVGCPMPILCRTLRASGGEEFPSCASGLGFGAA
jgi:hypothetical protein